jgi:broad specificity phosphatase PhoE
MYVSDLKRTIDTGKIILEYFPDESKPRFFEESRIREKCCGILEGQPLGTTSGLAKA